MKTDNDQNYLNTEERQLARRVKAALDQSVSQLDDEALAALAARRAEAVAFRRQRNNNNYGLAVGGALAAAVILFTINLAPRVLHTQEVAVLEDMELLSNADDLDLYENLEFYRWLGNENETG